jgi:hypothetical protein
MIMLEDCLEKRSSWEVEIEAGKMFPCGDGIGDWEVRFLGIKVKDAR